MPQGTVAFKYEENHSENSITGFAGLPVYLDLVTVTELAASIDEHLALRPVEENVWSDVEQIVSLILLNVAGGDGVDDIDKLNADKGLGRLLMRQKAELLEGLSRQQRRQLVRKWEKEGKRAFPSPTAVRVYLKNGFHDETQEEAREVSLVKAFIPKPNRSLLGLGLVNRDIVAFHQSRSPSRTATIDMDATLVYTNKKEAFHSYKGPKAYQPLNAWWAEQKMVLHTEFRDGNVPACYENLRFLIEALEHLPDGVDEVFLRSDTAAYQHDLMRYCENGLNERFGRIKFAIGCDINAEFKKAVNKVHRDDWKRVKKFNPRTEQYEDTRLECAEVCYVPSKVANSKKGLYRYIATRELLSDQQRLPGTEKNDEQQKLPFQTITLHQHQYKLHGLVTNLSEDDFSTSQIVEWLHERCGYSEKAHSMMKSDFAGGKLPSKYFGVNAAWWWIMMLSLNLTQLLKQLALGPKGATKRMKSLRFSLFNLPGRVVEHARQLIIRIAKGHPSFRWLLDIRRRIAALATAPT